MEVGEEGVTSDDMGYMIYMSLMSSMNVDVLAARVRKSRRRCSSQRLNEAVGGFLALLLPLLTSVR